MTPPFRRLSGGVGVRLRPDEAELLRQVPVLLDGVGSAAEDPGAQRLSFPVYLDEPAADAEFRVWMESELDQARAADRSAFRELVDAAREGEVLASLPEAEAFLRVLVEARLVLGARLGVEVEEDYRRLEEPEATVLEYLAYLQILLIGTLDTP